MIAANVACGPVRGEVILCVETTPTPETFLPYPEARVSIRTGRPDEADALAKLHVDVWRATYRDYASAEAFKMLDEAKRLPYWQDALLDKRPCAGVFVAEQDASLLGVVSYGPSQHESFAGRTEIKHLYVAELARGLGVGRLLLKAVLDDESAARPGLALAVVRQNNSARRFYKKMGGAEIGTFIDPGPLWKSENIIVAWD
ncbi:GNAT family N-acetyltransferase [Jannaschia pohangensis]|nr:GNAT family N-acetyltransferase [Jannaschia pohangensis]